MLRLGNMAQRYDEINELLINGTFADNREYARLSKEQSSLEAPVEAYRQLVSVMQQIEETESLLHDHELREMAELELEELNEQKQQLIDHLEVLLIPKDPNDDCNAIFEIRGAAGGDEGNIFAGDLYRMYTRYAENKGWKIELYDAEESEAGGFAQISFLVKGKEVYKEMKFESGAHRVQRVPKTESAGRVHTSTATVLVLPDVEDADVEINPDDLIIETHRASGAGGQHINKTDSAVRITHVPTGISVNCQDGRSQIQNREQAMRIITARVYDYYQRKMEEALHGHDGDDEANQAQRLDEGRRQDEDGEQVAFHLGLASHARRGAVGGDTDAQGGTEDADSVSEDGSHGFLLCRTPDHPATPNLYTAGDARVVPILTPRRPQQAGRRRRSAA